MFLGITGKIGAGKHTVARLLEKRGFLLIDADKLAHSLYVRGSKIWYELVDKFGKRILEKDFEIDRRKLGALVFADKRKLAELNAIVHPALKALIKTKIVQAKMRNQENLVVVAALGDEIDLKQLVEKVILVKAPLEKRLSWLKESRGMTEKEILERNDFQQEIENYDLEIVNEGSLEELEVAVEGMF